MKRFTAVLALLLSGHLPPALAKGTCSSDGRPAPLALYERFINADCAPCWGERGFAPGPGAAVLDWIAPAATGNIVETPATLRTRPDSPEPLRLLNFRIGQPRCLATVAILPSGLVGRGLPTRYISATSSSPSA